MRSAITNNMDTPLRCCAGLPKGEDDTSPEDPCPPSHICLKCSRELRLSLQMMQHHDNHKTCDKSKIGLHRHDANHAQDFTNFRKRIQEFNFEEGNVRHSPSANRKSRFSSSVHSATGSNLLNPAIQTKSWVSSHKVKSNFLPSALNGQFTSLFSMSRIHSPTQSQSSVSHSSQRARPSVWTWSPIKVFLLGLVLCSISPHIASAGDNSIIRASSQASLCSQTFTDAASSAYLADVVILGKVKGRRKILNDEKMFNIVVRRRKIFKGQNILKSKTSKRRRSNRLVIGKFHKKKENLKNCVGKVISGRTYIFYLRDIGPGLPLQIMAMPSLRSRNVTSAVQKVTCKRCASAPNIRKIAGPKSVAINKKIVLRCTSTKRTNPAPNFVWLKDGVEIKKRKGLSFRNRSHKSRLILRNTQLTDAGLYTCVARNAVGEDRKDWDVTVNTSPADYAPCKQPSYCLNNGKCFRVVALGDMPICKCDKAFTGYRCEEMPTGAESAIRYGQATLMYERTLIIIGIVLAVLVFIVICIASYFLAKARRKRFEQRKRRREAKRAARNLEARGRDIGNFKDTPSSEKHLANDVGVKASSLGPETTTALVSGPTPGANNTTTTTNSNITLALAQHEIHPLLLKKQQEQQRRLEQQQQKAAAEDEPDPQLEALLRSCDPNYNPNQDNVDRPESRRRLVASSHEDSRGLPSTFTACVDRKETTQAAVLKTPEDIEMNNINGDDQDYDNLHHSFENNSGHVEDLHPLGLHSRSLPEHKPMPTSGTGVSNASSPSPTSFSPRPESSASLSPPPYHSAVYIPSPTHHAAEPEEDSTDDITATLPLLAASQSRSHNARVDSGPEMGAGNPVHDYQHNNRVRSYHAPPLNNIRNWSSAPSSTAANSSFLNPPCYTQTQSKPSAYDDLELKGYGSDEEAPTERDSLLSDTPQTTEPNIRATKPRQLPTTYTAPPSVSHSNTFPKPTRVNGVIRGGSQSHYYDKGDDSSSSDENDEPREFPYQKQRDDLYISEDDLDLSKENLVSTSFSSVLTGTGGQGRRSRQLSREESRDMEEPVVGLLPSINLTAPRDQLRKYPSEEGPAYTIMAGKAQGLQLYDCSRSKSLDDPLVSSSHTDPTTTATASTSSLSTSPYSSTTVAAASDYGNPHNYHHPSTREDRSRLHSTLAGSPMLETYAEFDAHGPNPSRPYIYDPTEAGAPWDKETGDQQGSSRILFNEGVEGMDGREVSEEEREKDRLQRLKDVYPDQPAIPI